MRIAPIAAVFALALAALRAGAESLPAERGAADSTRGATYAFELDSRSRYVFRGMPLVDEPVGQLSASITARGFTFYAWGNFLLEGGLPFGRASESDFGAVYEGDWKSLTLRPELVAYVFHAPSGVEAKPTTEASLSVAYALGSLEIFTTQVVDLGSARGAYFGEAGLSFERPVRETLAIGASVSAAWASPRYEEALFGISSGPLDLLELEISATWTASESLYLRPHLELARALDPGLRRHIGLPIVASFGVAIGFERRLQ